MTLPSFPACPRCQLMPLKHLTLHYASKIAWWKALPIAFTGGVGYSILRDVLGWYEQLLRTDPVLVLLAITMLFADYITGTSQALWCWWKGHPDCGFSIEKQRDAARKLIMWTVTCGICIMLSNGFQRVPWPGMEYLAVFDYASLLLCAWVEGSSAAENCGAERLLRRVRHWARGEGVLTPPKKPKGDA